MVGPRGADGAHLDVERRRSSRSSRRSDATAARMRDEGHTFRGTDEIRGFLRTAGAEFTFTTELIGAQRVDDTHRVATNRLAELVIAP